MKEYDFFLDKNVYTCQVGSGTTRHCPTKTKSVKIMNRWMTAVWKTGSGALSGLMLDLGLLKISLRGVFLISSPCGGL